MSKYIRTKDGIYEVEWNNNVEMWCDVKTHKGFILDSMISKEDYILADTIKELCDEFFYNCKYKPPMKCYCYIEEKKYWIMEDAHRDLHKLSRKEIATIKGAIWTSKGLIFVAKMNNEGKLALI